MSVFRVKSLEMLLAETEEKDTRLKRTLGPVQLTSLGIGAIIGAGLFTAVGTAAAGGDLAGPRGRRGLAARDRA